MADPNRDPGINGQVGAPPPPLNLLQDLANIAPFFPRPNLPLDLQMPKRQDLPIYLNQCYLFLEAAQGERDKALKGTIETQTMSNLRSDVEKLKQELKTANKTIDGYIEVGQRAKDIKLRNKELETTIGQIRGERDAERESAQKEIDRLKRVLDEEKIQRANEHHSQLQQGQILKLNPGQIAHLTEQLNAEKAGRVADQRRHNFELKQARDDWDHEYKLFKKMTLQSNKEEEKKKRLKLKAECKQAVEEARSGLELAAEVFEDLLREAGLDVSLFQVRLKARIQQNPVPAQPPQLRAHIQNGQDGPNQDQNGPEDEEDRPLAKRGRPPKRPRSFLEPAPSKDSVVEQEGPAPIRRNLRTLGSSRKRQYTPLNSTPRARPDRGTNGHRGRGRGAAKRIRPGLQPILKVLPEDPVSSSLRVRNNRGRFMKTKKKTFGTPKASQRFRRSSSILQLNLRRSSKRFGISNTTENPRSQRTKAVQPNYREASTADEGEEAESQKDEDQETDEEEEEPVEDYAEPLEDFEDHDDHDN